MAKTNCIDISTSNTGLNYKQLKASGINAAIIRLGRKNFKDNMFEAHYSGVTNAGMRVGVYWLTEANSPSAAKTEAKRCISYLQGKQLDYPIYVGIEDYNKDNWYPSKFQKSRLTDIAMTFCATIQDSGYTAGVYASSAFFNTVLDHKKISKLYSIWLSQQKASNPSYNCDIWQTGVGTLLGSNGKINFNRVVSDKFKSSTSNVLEEFLKVAKAHSIDRLESYEEWTRGVLGNTGYDAWCAYFICACAKTVGVLGKIIANVGSVDAMMQGTADLGGKLHNGANYIPKPGDLFSLRDGSANTGYHIGIVHSVNGNSFTSCEGNHTPTSRTDTAGYLSGSDTYSVPSSQFYQFCTPDWGSVGGSFTSGGGSGQLYDTAYTRADAIIREVGYLNKKFEHSITPSKFKLCVMNYTPLLSDLWTRYSSDGTSKNKDYDTSGLSGNCKITVDYLINKGLNSAVACGIAGAIYVASNFNPRAKRDSDKSLGICLWTAEKSSAMRKYVGKTWATNLSKQLDFLWYDIEHNYSKVLAHLREISDTETGAKNAADYFVKYYISRNVVKIKTTKQQTKAVEYFKKINKSINSNSGMVYSSPNSRGWVWPTPGYGKNYITSWFDETRSTGNHGALDIGAPMGSKVLAGRAGKVISCCKSCTHNYGKDDYMWDDCGGGFGNNVWIDHGDGYVTIYGHLQTVMTSEGATVKAGQQIGKVGSTGWSTGAHLHYELRINDKKSNPLNLYSEGDIR